MQIKYQMLEKLKSSYLSLKEKMFNDIVKIKLTGKRIYRTASIKYLGVKIDQNLTWQYYINNLPFKMNRNNSLLFKIRKFVDDKTLKSDSPFAQKFICFNDGFSKIMKNAFYFISKTFFVLDFLGM